MRTWSLILAWFCGLGFLVSCGSSATGGESYIVYTTSEWPTSEVRLLKPDGSFNRVLAESREVHFYDGRLSPDGTKILYAVLLRTEDRTEFWVMNTDGTEQHAIFRGPEPQHVEQASWSSDGAKIAFTTQWDKSSSICSREFYVVDVASGNLAKLPITGWHYEWSTTGHRLAVLCASGKAGLYVIDLDTGEVRDLLVGVATHRTPQPDLAWSPDGARIAFAQGIGLNRQGIFVIDVASGALTQVTSEGLTHVHRSIGCLSWSPQGDNLLFTEDSTLYVLNLDREEEAELAKGVSWTCPVWSPDGEEIAFVSTFDPQYRQYGQIYKLDLGTGEVIQLTHDPNPKWSLSWDWVAFPRGQQR